MRIYSQDIGMELGIEKCAILVMKSGKWHIKEGVELPTQVGSSEREKGNYKYFGIWEANTIKKQEMKENFF